MCKSFPKNVDRIFFKLGDRPAPATCPICGTPTEVIRREKSVPLGMDVPEGTQAIVWWEHGVHDPFYCSCVITKRLESKLDELMFLLKKDKWVVPANTLEEE